MTGELFLQTYTVWKVSKYEDFSGPHFLVFSPNTGKYGKNSVFGHFSLSVKRVKEAEAHSEPSRTSKIVHSAKILIRLGFEYVS